MVWVAGVDGCRAGWFVIFFDTQNEVIEGDVCSCFQDVISHALNPSVIAVDIPIGLLEAASRGGRECDRYARQLLSRPRKSSVFPTPVRSAVYRDNYAEAAVANRASSKANIGISKQSFGIIPKIREVDQLMTPYLQERVKEIHPEICFWKMSDGKSMKYKKSTSEGVSERSELLARNGMGDVSQGLGQYQSQYVQKDDVLDAGAACWTAHRIYRGYAEKLPLDPSRDAENLAMEMWF